MKNLNPVTFLSFFPKPWESASHINRKRFETFSEALKFYAKRERPEDAANERMCYYPKAQVSIDDNGLPGFYIAEHPNGTYHFEIQWRAINAAGEELLEGNIGAEELAFAELLAEVRGRSEEQRSVLEQHAGEIRVLSEAISDLQNTLDRPVPSVRPDLIRRIWLRAFLLSLAVTMPSAFLIGWLLSRAS